MVKSYQNLDVWKKAMDLVETVFSLTGKLPREQIYGLSAQMQRSSTSIPSNIAEGHARSSTKEYLYHVSVSLGSIAELETQLLLCERLRFFSREDVRSALAETDEIGKMLRGLQLSLREKLN